jgi:hypothetical protein
MDRGIPVYADVVCCAKNRPVWKGPNNPVIGPGGSCLQNVPHATFMYTTRSQCKNENDLDGVHDVVSAIA